MDETAATSHPASWIDGLVRMVDSLPLPPWLIYTIFLVGLVLLNNAVFWIDGGLRFGNFDPDLSVLAVFVPYWLAGYHLLSRQASRALLRFRPLLQASDSELAGIEFDLLTLPRNLGLISIFLGTAIALGRGVPDSTISPAVNLARTVLPAAYLVLLSAFIGITFVAFAVRTLRQLRLVSKLHEQASGIDLLSLDAAHSFAGLTARTGLVLILLLVILNAPAPWNPGESVSVIAIDLFLYFVIALLAVAAFVIPLEGMHGRLEEEKDRALDELDELYKSVSSRLYSDVKNDRYEEMASTKETISALLMHRERLEKISTWPWDPRTIRGFTSALLLPIFLLLIGRLIERLL